MEIRQLKYFTVAAETLSLSKAAGISFISQSAFSNHISKLEAELGIQLFSRHTWGVDLTPAGKVFQKDVRKILLQLDQTIESAKLTSSFGHEVRKLIIGIEKGANFQKIVDSLLILKRALKTVEKDQDITLEYKLLEYSEAVSKLKKQEIDMALAYVNDTIISSNLSKPNRDLEYKIISEDRLVMIVNNSMTISQYDMLSNRIQNEVDMNNITCYIFPGHSRIVEDCKIILDRMGIHPIIVLAMELSELANVIMQLEMSNCIAFMPKGLCDLNREYFCDSLRMIELESGLGRFYQLMLYHSNSTNFSIPVFLKALEDSKC